MKRLFGTDGMRGEAGRFPLDAATVRMAARSLARHLAARIEDTHRAVQIVVGRDTRESGEWLEQSLMEGAREAGAECLSAGVITTPGVAYLARTLNADAGVVISASHNPYQDNGIKIFAPSGRKLDDATERLIEADILAHADNASTQYQPTDNASVNLKTEATGAFESAGLRARYLDYLADEVAAGLSLEGLRIVIDCANGAASQLAPALLTRLGARVIAIHDAPDGRNINRECGSLHIDGLRRKVIEEGADLGVAYDGDADRALFVDARGQFVDGDATLWVMAKYLDQHGELNGGQVVATVMSNIGLEIALRSQGLQLLRTDVGDKYVLDELLRTKAELGGEQSGHIIFPRRSLAGDGMTTTLYLLRAMRETGAQLSSLNEGFERYPQVLVNVRVRAKPPFEELLAVTRAADEVSARLGDAGRLLLRYSGTEPLARVMIEGQRQDEIERYANTLASVIKETIG
ncbi:MAG TPA: phosphoglucosamine mutase [Pyrinomonadaceae bacterium]|jgi:phosphoglucosamine mutase|nr:phosphoglucosamine mutase [Pyrinomonadaceae bacterium]